MLLVKAVGTVPFEVATVDHGLRPESNAEASFVANLCMTLGIPHTTLRVAVGQGNLQAEARRVRYAALAEWAKRRGLGALATAHHADDQAETMLMRLNRGSGVAGLSGIRRESHLLDGTPRVIRPLLTWRKAELEAVVAACGVEPVRDPSNDNFDFDRVKVRHLIASSDWIDPIAIANSAIHVAEADMLIDDLASGEWSAQVVASGAQFRYHPVQPRIVRLRVIQRVIQELTGRGVRGASLADLEQALTEGRGGNLGGVLARCEENGDWVFEREPPRHSG